MNRKVLVRNFVMVFALIMGLALTSGCDLVATYSNPTYELTVRNKYDAPVTVEIGTKTVELQAYGSHHFTVSDSLMSSSQIWANGKYFSFYSKRQTLREGVMNYHDLEPNIGWFGLANNCSEAIVFPKYGSKYFSYDESGNYVQSTVLLPGETRYIKVQNYSSTYGDITFKFSGNYQYYKVSSIFTSPSVGYTNIIRLYNSTRIEKTPF